LQFAACPDAVAPRNKTTEGALSLVAANKVPKSVSAETITRPSSRARRKIVSSSALQAIVPDVGRVVTSLPQPFGDRGRQRVVHEKPHGTVRGNSRSRTASAA
jgi:hypothetical protein